MPKSFLPRLFISLSLLAFSPLVQAASGCCSYHGGVASCDVKTGYDLCKDGTDSPSCTCNGTATTKISSAATTHVKTQAASSKSRSSKSSKAAKGHSSSSKKTHASSSTKAKSSKAKK